MINLISEEVYPPPIPHPLDNVMWIVHCYYSQRAVTVNLQASMRPKPLNHAVLTRECILDKNTPECWKQGLCLSHIGNVASPEVNVEDVHQTSLEQLLGTWEVVISYLEFNLDNWELNIKTMLGIVHFDPMHAWSSRQFGRTCNLQPIAIAIQ